MPNNRKPTALHVIDGSFRPGRHAARTSEPQPTGSPVKPKYLKGKASRIWDEHVQIGHWLTAADSLALAAWCSLGAEMERKFADMPASRISQWRTLGAELGFLCASRSRINVNSASKAKEDPAEKYFA